MSKREESAPPRIVASADDLKKVPLGSTVDVQFLDGKSAYGARFDEILWLDPKAPELVMQVQGQTQVVSWKDLVGLRLV